LTPLQPVSGEISATPIQSDLSSPSLSDTPEDTYKLPVTAVADLHLTGSAPEIDINKYRLVVDGLVNTPLNLDYGAIMRYPTVTQVVLLICPEFFEDNAEWTGVPVSTILREAGAKPGASQVSFYSGSYEITLPLEKVRQEGVFLAHSVDGQILPKEHGFPLRLVVQGEYGSNWVKWLDRIEIK